MTFIVIRMNTDLQDDVDEAIRRGLAFLAERQKPTGEFLNFIASDEHMVKDRKEDPSPFMTQHIVASLLEVDDGEASRMVDNAMDFLDTERFPGGLWRFWNKSHPGVTYIPPDTDDTASIAYLMRNVGKPESQTREILLGNRNRKGLFYTWVMPRARHLMWPSAWLPLLLAGRYPHRLFAFFRAGKIKPSPGQVDVVVNANAVLYLGETRDTAAAIRWIREAVLTADAETPDRYYQSPFPLYYAVLRCVESRIRAFDDLRPVIVERVESSLVSKDAGDMNALQKALCAIVLAAWDPGSPRLTHVVEALLESQRADGSWPIAVFYYDGRGSKEIMLRWGCEELVTAFCLEALARVKRTTFN